MLAYCERIVGPEHAMAAAAEAFRRFRAAVVVATDLTGLNPEALLLSATRHAAAERVPRPPDSPDVVRFVARRPATGWCGDTPALLAARADRTISTIDLARLEQHLHGCAACRAPEARFNAAERAYRDPPDAPLPLPVTAAIMSALAAAAPVSPAQAASNGAGTAHTAMNGVAPEVVDVPREPEPEPAPEPPVVQARPPLPDPPPVVQTPPPLPDPPAPPRLLEPPAAVTPPPESPPTEVHAHSTSEYSMPEFIDLGGTREPEAKPAKRKLALPSPRVRRRERPPREPANAAVGSERPDRAAAARATSAGSPLSLATILPVVLVVGAIVVGLAVAGVFGGGNPPDTPATQAPATQAPSDAAEPPDVVVVPGGTASAAAVEAAKARARAKARREAARQKQGAGDAPSSSSDSQQSAAPPPPPPPPPASSQTPSQSQSSPGSTGTPSINGGSSTAGSGQATGDDTSNVPDLAPAP